MRRDACISTAVCITEVGLLCFELVMIINNKLWTSTCDERYGPCISAFWRVNDKQKYCSQRRKFTAMVGVNIIQSLWILIMFFVSVLQACCNISLKWKQNGKLWV